MNKLNGTAKFAVGIIVLLLASVLGYVVNGQSVQTDSFQKHVLKTGHTGTITRLDSIDKWIEHLNKKTDSLQVDIKTILQKVE